MELKNQDRKLIYELDKNSRLPISAIAKHVRISQQLANYKINNYLSDGLISSFNAFIDYARFGYLHFRVYFKINYLSDEKFKELIQTLLWHQSIVELNECGGKYDLIAVFASLNPSEFNKRFKELISRNPAQLKNYSILTTVVNHYYPRSYLAPVQKDTVSLFREEISDIILGGDRSILTIHRKEKQLLWELQENARLPTLSLAKKIRVDQKTARIMINRLQEASIIKAYRPLFNVQTVGFIVNKILLKYHNFSVEKEQELLTFCKFNPNVIELVKVFGEWDVELTVETKTREEFQRVYISIREKFEDIIQDFESFPIFKTHRKTFLPMSMFS